MDKIDDIVIILETSEDATTCLAKAETLYWLAFGNEGNCKGIFQAEGIIRGLMRVMGKDVVELKGGKGEGGVGTLDGKYLRELQCQEGFV